MVYSPLDALKIARQNPGPAGGVHGHRLRDHGAVDRADRAARGRRKASSNFSVFCNHVTIMPAIKAILDSPDLRLDGFIGPGHVSTVIGCRPYEFIARDYGKPVVVAGFEPLDILQSIYMLLRQLAEGRAEVENQYARVVPWDGNPVGPEGDRRTMELRPYFEWRGLGFISHSALKVREKYAAFDAERLFEVPGVRVADPKACQCGEVLEGRAQAVGVQGVRHRVHAGDADRHLHGVVRGRLRGVLQLRPVRSRARGHASRVRGRRS